MATVRDPNFWKRFSAAVHQDELEKGIIAQSDLKHSYVTYSSLPSPTTPTSFAFVATLPRPLSPVALLTSCTTTHAAPHRTPKTPRRLAKAPPAQARRPSAAASASASPHRRPSLAHVHLPFTRHANASQQTLGLSGRPPSRFKFWTQVSADPSNRDSWLAGQRRKKKQRTWICWAFWGLFLALVAGVVVAVVLLRRKGII